ncbi:hypothetical protein ILYODFUR_025646 [Ilyodon furcidens]|uniref:Uncharacterized protein n=1 Tax=Ilyodon furcidens TaxID=33524 RepID=A0ABV0V626_9TELE
MEEEEEDLRKTNMCGKETENTFCSATSEVVSGCTTFVSAELKEQKVFALQQQCFFLLWGSWKHFLFYLNPLGCIEVCPSTSETLRSLTCSISNSFFLLMH